MTKTETPTPRTDALDAEISSGRQVTWLDAYSVQARILDLARQLERELSEANEARERAEERVKFSEVLCRIYFDIAAKAIGEDVVRTQRDIALADSTSDAYKMARAALAASEGETNGQT